MDIDSHTVTLYVLLTSFVMSAGLFALSRSFPNYMKGTTHAVSATLVQAVGWAVLGVGGTLFGPLSVVAGYTLITLGVALYYHAVKAFKDESFRVVGPYALPAAAFAASTYFTAADPNPAARSAAVSAAAAFLFLMCVKATAFDGTSPRGFSHWFTAGAFALSAAVLAAIALYAVAFRVDAAGPVVQASLERAFLFSFQITVTGFAFGYVLMCHDRYVLDIEHLVMLDSLTETYNRRAIRYLVQTEIARSTRGDLPMSVMVIDIDRFKFINDTLGHSAGDAVLKFVAATLGDQLREQDLVGRYGGDEFLVVLPDTVEAEAPRIAERICRAVDETKLAIDNRSIGISLSVGVACLRHKEPDCEQLIRRADLAMYESKNLGGNCVSVADQLP
ncbi:MAG: GGDEF domain-containing protein [Chloroflexi bacterium]|nr:GGDEF domain-containing protein [Chloroflexota bacterium]